MVNRDYPTPDEVDEWCAALLRRAEERAVAVREFDAEQYSYRLAVRHTVGNRYLALDVDGPRTYYGFWQPAPAGPAPILFHLPSYAGEIAAHPTLVLDGFHVLHINPLGYYTPYGPGRTPEQWTVVQDTLRPRGEGGYADWLTDATAAVLWALGRTDVQPDRFAFFGTSQGGGGALLMASLFAGRGVRAVAADVPFLTGFARYAELDEDGRRGFRSMFGPEERRAAEWKALGYVDTLSHAHRLSMPTLLTAGSQDEVCPPETIAALFERLPGTRSHTLLSGHPHAASVPFLDLARAWFRLFV